MSFKLEATGFKDLKNVLGAIRREMVNPESGISESLIAGGWVIALQARDNAVAQGLFLSGELIDSIVPVRINQFRIDVEVGAPHGAAHEFGLANQAITDRQRRFFWAMHVVTGESMWLALALSQTYTIPARPYLRPAIDERKKDAAKASADELAVQIKETARRMAA